MSWFVFFFCNICKCLKVNKKGFEEFPDDSVLPMQGAWVRSLVGEVPHAMWYSHKKKKKKRFSGLLSCFQSYAFVANQELLISTFLPLHSCELSSKTPVAAFIIMLSVRLAHSTTLFWILPFISGRKFPLRQKLKDFYVPELQGLVQWAFERTIWRVQQRHSHVLLSECTI